MSQAAVFKCPSCGAYLEYQPGQKSLKCPYCSSVMDEEQLLSMSQKEETEAWQHYFADRKLKQPFEQVWEPVADTLMEGSRATGTKWASSSVRARVL